MDSLIAELERAQEGSRELDALVFCAVFHPDKKPERNFFYTNREEWGVFVTNQPRPGTTFHDAPHYSTNLQDALGLVPEGMGYVVSDADWSTARASVAWKNTPLNFDAPKFDVRAATPALALTIAALKARREA